MGCTTSIVDRIISKEIDESKLIVNEIVEEALQFVKLPPDFSERQKLKYQAKDLSPRSQGEDLTPRSPVNQSIEITDTNSVISKSTTLDSLSLSESSSTAKWLQSNGEIEKEELEQQKQQEQEEKVLKTFESILPVLQKKDKKSQTTDALEERKPFVRPQLKPHKTAIDFTPSSRARSMTLNSTVTPIFEIKDIETIEVAGGTETSTEAMTTARNVASEMAQQVRNGRQMAKLATFSEDQQQKILQDCKELEELIPHILETTRLALLVCQCQDPQQWALEGNKLKVLLQKIGRLHHQIDEDILPQKKPKPKPKTEEPTLQQSVSMPRQRSNTITGVGSAEVMRRNLGLDRQMSDSVVSRKKKDKIPMISDRRSLEIKNAIFPEQNKNVRFFEKKELVEPFNKEKLMDVTTINAKQDFARRRSSSIDVQEREKQEKIVLYRKDSVTMLKSILKNNIAGSMTVKFSDEDIKRLAVKQIMTGTEVIFDNSTRTRDRSPSLA